ncbi:MAG: 3',5'-cyclic-nucleotide phosphodiesterase [Deltaproteobacteria bacterium]|nr:3',5'-cyclic-nucleotide phosphodiesterase [Deltaproteobacteria bacterium]
MRLRILGCHGGETPRHRMTSFLVDGRLALDAGAITSMLTLEEQSNLDAVLVTHAHMDHVRDLATLADNRCQSASKPLVIAGTRATVEALRTHFFNNVLWPDFAAISMVSGELPTIEFQVLEPEAPSRVAGFETVPVLVTHTIETAGFLVSDAGRTLAFSGDTGPTERFWEVLQAHGEVQALLQEVSFPDHLGWLALRSGHHTPETVAKELPKLRDLRPMVLFYHLKPQFQAELERGLARITGWDTDVISEGDVFDL